MAKKIRLTRPELKRQRDALRRYDRYLPMLKLKQQQLQVAIREVDRHRLAAEAALRAARQRFDAYQAVLADLAGLDVAALARPDKVDTATANIAGINMPVFRKAVFSPARYSLFTTAPWVDRAIADLRQVSRHQAELQVLQDQDRLLRAELTKIIQRVNLFEKVMIPRARETIRRIRIQLGDEMTAAVGRGKLAKARIEEAGSASIGTHLSPESATP